MLLIVHYVYTVSTVLGQQDQHLWENRKVGNCWKQRWRVGKVFVGARSHSGAIIHSSKCMFTCVNMRMCLCMCLCVHMNEHAVVCVCVHVRVGTDAFACSPLILIKWPTTKFRRWWDYRCWHISASSLNHAGCVNTTCAAFFLSKSF